MTGARTRPFGQCCLSTRTLTTPKVINTYQTVYQRTGVDLNSRWLVEWKGLCQGQLLSDLSCPGHRDATAILQCAEGDLVVECELRASGIHLPIVQYPRRPG
jgi:hypothetical protein